eukprot:908378-Prymnesium_polylepis.2
MAADVIEILKALATAGRTIISTIHQPSYSVFCKFDNLVLLTRGHVVYAGALPAATAHFGALGYEMPLHENPAEHLITVLDAQESTGEPGKFVDAWRARERDASSSGGQHAVAQSLPATSYTASPLKQWRVLLARNVYDQAKDPRKLLQLLALRLGIGVVVGALFYDQGRIDNFNTGAVSSCTSHLQPPGTLHLHLARLCAQSSPSRVRCSSRASRATWTPSWRRSCRRRARAL